jgi:hypothetical protein
MPSTDVARADQIAWKSDDGVISCRLIQGPEGEFVVRVDVQGCKLSLTEFVDPIKAVEEVARLRRLFIG